VAVNPALTAPDPKLVDLLGGIDDPEDQVGAWVAGPAALLVAKAHKVRERLDGAAARPDRLRPKDSGDIALLMMASQPGRAAEQMIDQSEAHPEIRETVVQAARWLVDTYADPQSITRRHAVEAVADRFDEPQANSAIQAWLQAFRDATAAFA
jgi:hypothetical protein